LDWNLVFSTAASANDLPITWVIGRVWIIVEHTVVAAPVLGLFEMVLNLLDLNPNSFYIVLKLLICRDLIVPDFILYWFERNEMSNSVLSNYGKFSTFMMFMFGRATADFGAVLRFLGIISLWESDLAVSSCFTCTI
jgi:hypothetical protein